MEAARQARPRRPAYQQLKAAAPLQLARPEEQQEVVPRRLAPQAQEQQAQEEQESSPTGATNDDDDGGGGAEPPPLPRSMSGEYVPAAWWASEE